MATSKERIAKVVRTRAAKTDASQYFPKSWYDNVDKAIGVAIQHCVFDQSQVEPMINYILDYNIEKHLEECFLPNLVKSLPTSYDWSKKNAIDIFEDFKDIVDSCDVCPKFKTYKAKIIFNKSGLIKNTFLLWKEHVNTYYPHLFVEFTPTNIDNVYTLKLEKRSS